MKKGDHYWDAFLNLVEGKEERAVEVFKLLQLLCPENIETRKQILLAIIDITEEGITEQFELRQRFQEKGLERYFDKLISWGLPGAMLPIS